MEGPLPPCGIGSKWPRMALLCQSLIFNVVVVAKAADRKLREQVATHQMTATLFLFNRRCSRAALQRGTDTPTHAESHEPPCQLHEHSHSPLHCVEAIRYSYLNVILGLNNGPGQVYSTIAWD